jgi:hypothetical protein
MKRAVKRTLMLLMALAGASAALPAVAFTRVVKPGDSLAAIAARVYGDPKLEGLIAAANGLDAEGGVAPVPGMRLEVPAPGHHRVVPGETWPAIAERTLGDAARSDVLARANGAVPWVPPDKGAEIVIPYVLTVVAAESDRLDTIAKRFWGDPNRAWELDAYNARKGAPLKRGEVVLVPLPRLALTPEGKADAKDAMAEAATEGDGSVLELQRHAEAEATECAALLRAGRYAEVAIRASSAIGSGSLYPREGAHYPQDGAYPREGALTPNQEAALQRVLVEALVALDAKEAAARACVRWRAIDQKARLDPVRTSPKIRAVCATR